MYSRTVTWIVKDKWIGQKKEFYDEDGEHLKTLSVKKYEKIKDSNDESKQQEFIAKYWEKFPRDKLFIDDPKLGNIKNKYLQEQTKINENKKEVVIKDNNITTWDDDNNKLYIYLLILVWIIWVLALLVIHKKKDKQWN